MPSPKKKFHTCPAPNPARRTPCRRDNSNAAHPTTPSDEPEPPETPPANHDDNRSSTVEAIEGATVTAGGSTASPGRTADSTETTEPSSLAPTAETVDVACRRGSRVLTIVAMLRTPAAAADGALLCGAWERPFGFEETDPVSVPESRPLDPTEPPDPVESANATAGKSPPAKPTPSNTANTPTRPT